MWASLLIAYAVVIEMVVGVEERWGRGGGGSVSKKRSTSMWTCFLGVLYITKVSYVLNVFVVKELSSYRYARPADRS